MNAVKKYFDEQTGVINYAASQGDVDTLINIINESRRLADSVRDGIHKSYDWMVVSWTLPRNSEEQSGWYRINHGERLPMPDKYQTYALIRLSNEGWLMVNSWSGSIKDGVIDSSYYFQRESQD